MYKNQKIVERFGLAVQGVVSLCVRVLKNIRNCLPLANTSTSSAPSEVNDMKKDIWSHEELERLLQYVAKVFMLQFPLYAGNSSTLYYFYTVEIQEFSCHSHFT